MTGNRDNILFYWSGVFGEEGWFISDFGVNFQYKLDVSSQAQTTQSTAAVEQSNTTTTTDTTSTSSANITTSTANTTNTTTSAIQTISFPSLHSVLEQKFAEISKSKHFPLNPTYLKSRVLQYFK